jgi:large subunit ribosomal protein L25
VVLIGEAKGVKEGGIVAQVLREIEIEGLPLDIPKKIELDISELAIGFSSHVSSIKLPANLRIITSPGETIVSIVTKTEEVAVATPEEGAPTGPEVIKEKKEGAEGEKGEGEGAPAAKEEPKEKAKEEPRDKGKDKGKEKGKEKGKDEGKGKK